MILEVFSFFVDEEDDEEEEEEDLERVLVDDEDEDLLLVFDDVVFDDDDDDLVVFEEEGGGVGCSARYLSSGGRDAITVTFLFTDKSFLFSSMKTQLSFHGLLLSKSSLFSGFAISVKNLRV